MEFVLTQTKLIYLEVLIMARPELYNRRTQPMVAFRTDEFVKDRLKSMCKDKGVSVQEYLEELVKHQLLIHCTKKEHDCSKKE